MRYEEVKKRDIGILPTPIVKLENMSEKYFANIFLKRDDMTGLGMGGNKIRKLEYLAEDAINNKYTTLLTYGALQTNHGMLTSCVANKCNLKSILMLKNFEKEEPCLSGNIVLDTILGADIRYINLAGLDNESIKKEIERKTVEVVKEYEDRGERVYIIPTGGSSTLGALGYVNCIDEIIKQSDDMNIDFKYIICGQGSKGTFSGLWLGSRYFNKDYEVIGMNVSEEGEGLKERIKHYINKISERFSMGITCDEDLHLIDKCVLGYAIPDRETFKVVRELASLEGLFLDPTYTGKAFKGLIDLIKEGAIDKSKNILFIHTGGYPGLFSNVNVSFMENNLDLFL